MFEQAFKNIDDVLWKEAGCTTELDYTEQTSWLLFLKYLDGLEQDRADEAGLEGKRYAYILDKPYRWESWIKNKIQSGYNLREIIDHIDELRFRSQTEKHELSHLYEAKIKNMGNAGRNGGEYYSPRPLIRAIVQVVKPKIGDRIYDGACSSAGFLCESFDFLKLKKSLTTRELKTLQERTFYGKEKKSLAYVIAIMNMILHGIDAPNILHTNTLTENLAEIQGKDRFDVVLANPPFGGKERKEVQQNFPIRTGETAFLFLQHFIKMLRAGGRGGVVIKNTFLSNTDNASVSLRKLLLESCNLHTVLDCPQGTFQGAGVMTVVLFFEKGAPTRKVWFYQLDPGRSLGKTNPLNDDDLKEFVTLQKTFADSPKSWSVDAKGIEQEQRGKGRAEYGREVIKALAERLTAEFGRGFSASNLAYMRSFFLFYQDRIPIFQSVIGKLSHTKKLQSPTAKSPTDQKSQPLTDQFPVVQPRPFTLSCDEEHFFVDLVFYNRLLRCYVLIDLKIGKLTHQDLGQMQMYVHYFDREVKWV